MPDISRLSWQSRSVSPQRSFRVKLRFKIFEAAQTKKKLSRPEFVSVLS
jgi:hypothetical protein